MKPVPSLMAMFLLASFASPAQAYLDPGTGSLLIQGMIAAVTGALVTAGMYWQRIKTWGREVFRQPAGKGEAMDDDKASVRESDPVDRG